MARTSMTRDGALQRSLDWTFRSVSDAVTDCITRLSIRPQSPPPPYSARRVCCSRVQVRRDLLLLCRLFFFQAEDRIRDSSVTGVQTCALFFSSRRRHTRFKCDWSSDVCSSDLKQKTAYEIQV